MDTKQNTISPNTDEQDFSRQDKPKRNGEDAILDLIDKYFPNRHAHMTMGRGDDCALIAIPSAPGVENSPLFAITSDIFAENAHFRTSYFTASDIGHKALAVNISDLASNGAKPLAFSLNLTLTDNQDFAWLEECLKSMAELANQYDMVLCGGDLTKVPTDKFLAGGLNIGITAWGSYEHGGVPLMRHRAYTFSRENPVACMQAGDIVFYLGNVGLARTGLYVLEESLKKENLKEESLKKTVSSDSYDRSPCLLKFPQATNAHLRPMPLVEEGLLLSEFAKKFPLFVMDISDGLMRDVPRLLARQGIVLADEKKLGAELFLPKEAVHAEIQDYCAEKNLDPVLFAYKGGEDYGLLGVCAKDAFFDLQEYWQLQSQSHAVSPIHILGTVTTGNITLNQEPIEEAGFDHFQ